MKTRRNIPSLLFLAMALPFLSCEKFVTLNTPNGSVANTDVYASDATATAGVLQLYSSGNHRDAMLNTTLLSGMAADELVNSQGFDFIIQFQNNAIDPNNNTNANMIWYYTYQQIRVANMAIAGLSASTTLTPSVKSQLLGEAMFWRGYTYFVLVNFYSGVPLGLSPEALENAELPRSNADEVWAQVFRDLTGAKALLTPAYPSNDRARVNVHAVSALLSRAYLYRGQWAQAEAEANEVISSGSYSLSSLGETFTKTSNETILQIYTLNGFTQWGVNFVPATSTSGNPNYVLRSGFITSFELDDQRLESWVSAIGADEWYIDKYKLRQGNDGNEYYSLFRLAELHLIRAEARAQQDRLSGPEGAATDLNAVRERAGLEGRSGLTKAEMLLAIEQERKVELFGEWAHRWFDLKRTPSVAVAGRTRADDILGPLKGEQWQPTDILFPIPSQQIAINPALTQNDGYN